MENGIEYIFKDDSNNCVKYGSKKHLDNSIAKSKQSERQKFKQKLRSIGNNKPNKSGKLRLETCMH